MQQLQGLLLYTQVCNIAHALYVSANMLLVSFQVQMAGQKPSTNQRSRQANAAQCMPHVAVQQSQKFTFLSLPCTIVLGTRAQDVICTFSNPKLVLCPFNYKHVLVFITAVQHHLSLGQAPHSAE